LAERLTLHDMLLRDWGTDLFIRGGSGGSREDPIIITASDPSIVAETRLLTLRGIGRGRGIFCDCFMALMLSRRNLIYVFRPPTGDIKGKVP